MMIQETDTTTRSAASAIDTGYPMTGSSSWSVRRDSIQNLEVRKREAYEKPSVKRKKKSEAARKRKFK